MELDEIEAYKEGLFADYFFDWMRKGGSVYGLSEWVEQNADLKELKLEFDLQEEKE